MWGAGSAGNFMDAGGWGADSEVAFLRGGHLDSLGKKSPQCRGKYCLEGSVLGVGNVAQEVSALCQHCIDWDIPALGRWR